MSRRRKTRFEKWFSYTRYRRRFGARTLAAELPVEDLEAIKNSTVLGDDAQYAYGSLPNLAAHMQRLRREFIGHSELLYHHAALIVLIRREADVARNFARFRYLWDAESAYLLQHLDLRWLIAACDTLIDHDRDAVLRATLMNAVVLVNTVKLQETERFLQGQRNAVDLAGPVEQLRVERVALCDGLSAFVAGTDDTLRNMRWRLEQVCALHPLGVLVMEVFERMQQDGNENTYRRFRERHTRERTRWW